MKRNKKLVCTAVNVNQFQLSHFSFICLIILASVQCGRHSFRAQLKSKVESEEKRSLITYTSYKSQITIYNKITVKLVAQSAAKESKL